MKFFEIILVCIAAILTVFSTYKWESKGKFEKATLIITIIASILVAINSYRQSSKERIIERINAKFGDIKDLHGAKVPQMKIGNKEEGASFILGGDGVFNLSPFGPLIKLYIKNDKLYVNTIIRNLDGKIIAAIEDNTWTLFDSDFEYNDDNNTAFEIVTKGEREVFFQIELKKGIAYISGRLLNDKGLGFIFYNPSDGTTGSFMFPIGSDEAKNNIPKDLNINRIFKYPREKYYNEKL